MWCVLTLLVLACVTPTCTSHRGFFSTGAVLSESGKTRELVDARKGYQLGVSVVNRLNNGRGFAVEDRNGKKHFFKLSFQSLDNEGDKRQHIGLVKPLLTGDKPLDFLFGSHPEFAWEETALANKHERINIQCCVGLGEVYEQDFPYVFGVHVSNRRYPELAMHSMALRGIKRIAVVSRQDNPFTNTTCSAALDLAQQLGHLGEEALHLEVLWTYSDGDINEIGFFDRLAEMCIERGVEAVVACSLLDDGQKIIDAFHSARKSMKAFFMTTGPTIAEWVQETGPKADYLLSGGQWHSELSYSDELFGTTHDYKKEYAKLHGQGNIPSYISASASAAVQTVVSGIQDAFFHCDLSQTNGDVEELLYNTSAIICDENEDEDGSEGISGYERVRRALESVDIDSFFGKIKFNALRQNIGNNPATTQVLTPTGKDMDIYAVLPVQVANARLVMPAKNKYRSTCKPGYFVGPDDFEPCPQCQKGEYSSVEDAAHCDHCPAGYWTSEEGQRECQPCPKGTTTDGPRVQGLEYCHCKEGFYNVEGKSGVECVECPFGAYCGGKFNTPVARKGYWMNSTVLNVAHECDPQSVCLGGANSRCKDGHSGRLCVECSPGYYSVINSCYKCSSRRAVVAAYILLVFSGWYMINVVVSKSVASLEMILGWAQLANVIGDVGLRWPQNLQLVFGIANLLDFDVDILEPSCLTEWSFLHNHVVQLLLPFIMSLMAYTGYLASHIVHHFKPKMSARSLEKMDWVVGWLISIPHDDEDLSMKWDATIATFLSSVEVTYITVAKYSFDVFKCEEIGGVTVLRSAPSIVCRSQEHSIMVCLGVIGILVYSLGYLVFVAWKLRQLHAQRSFQHTRNLRRYGFLYYRFELEYSWTPIVVLARRLLFISVLVCVHNPGFQAGALATIITASLMLHIYTTPYVDSYLDVLFSFLLVALMLESFSGVLFYSTNLPSVNRAILEWIVLVFFFLLGMFSLYYLALELKKKFEHHAVRQMHCKSVLDHTQAFPSTLPVIFSMVSPEARDVKKRISDDLLETFDSSFVYNALKNHPEHIHKWDKLNNMLKGHLSEQSECSYLSRDPVAKFWRKLVKQFPELVDYLAVASNRSRKHFFSFATTLFRDFYLKNKVNRLPVFGVLNWRDRAPLAQWLATADEPQRRFFASVMSDLFKAVDGDTAVPRNEEEASTSSDPGPSELSTSWLRIRRPVAPKPNALRSAWSRVGNSSSNMARSEINSGRSPLQPKRVSFRMAVGHMQAAMHLANHSSRNSMPSVSEDPGKEEAALKSDDNNPPP